MEYKYPQKLVEILEEQTAEGAEIFISDGTDSTIFFAVDSVLKGWVVVIEWFAGSEDISMVNISNKAFKRLHKIIHEIEE